VTVLLKYKYLKKHRHRTLVPEVTAQFLKLVRSHVVFVTLISLGLKLKLNSLALVRKRSAEIVQWFHSGRGLQFRNYSTRLHIFFGRRGLSDDDEIFSPNAYILEFEVCIKNGHKVHV
jgi:hypothetical protein